MIGAFDFLMPTETLFGRGRVGEIGAHAARFGKKALLVTMPEPALEPAYALVKKALAESGVAVFHFGEVVANPTTDCITLGAQMARECGADMILGMGGGSSMDAAKAIAVEATHPGTAWDYIHSTDGPTEKTLPILLIGTTAGTGSQTTPFAVFTNPALKDKSAIAHKNVFAKVSIVDPDLTVTMSPEVTAQTGFDAFCHNFETYVSKKANPPSESMSLDAIAIIAEYLPRAVADGNDMEARVRMSWADTLGGITNSLAGTVIPHGLGMQVGGHCPHVTHGQSLAVLYPEFMRFTYPCAVEKFAKVGRIFNPALSGVPDEEAAKLSCEEIDKFLKRIGLWFGLNDLGVSEADIRAAADCGHRLGDYMRNPRFATIEDMYTMLMNSRVRR